MEQSSKQLMNVGLQNMLYVIQTLIEDHMSEQAPMTPPLPDQVVAWLKQNNYHLASFDRIISHVGGASNYEQLNILIQAYPNLFRSARLKGGMPGLALVNPYAVYVPVTPVQEEVTLYKEELIQKTPIENLKILIEKAATAEISGSAKNFAEAAAIVANAIAMANLMS